MGGPFSGGAKSLPRAKPRGFRLSMSCSAPFEENVETTKDTKFHEVQVRLFPAFTSRDGRPFFRRSEEPAPREAEGISPVYVLQCAIRGKRRNHKGHEVSRRSSSIVSFVHLETWAALFQAERRACPERSRGDFACLCLAVRYSRKT